MQRRELNEIEKAYIKIYARELAGGERIYNNIVDRKHAGLAIIAFFSNPKNGWRLNIIGRQFLNGLAKSADQRDFSRYQFLIATNIESGARILIDLGSGLGNLLVGAQRTMETEEFRSMYHAGIEAMKAAAKDCQADPIHFELNERFYSPKELTSMSLIIEESVDLPEPSYWTGNVFLRSDYQKFSWLPLTRPTLIYIGNHLFGLDPNKLDGDNFLEYFGDSKIWSYLSCVPYKGISSREDKVNRKFMHTLFSCCKKRNQAAKVPAPALTENDDLLDNQRRSITTVDRATASKR